VGSRTEEFFTWTVAAVLVVVEAEAAALAAAATMRRSTSCGTRYDIASLKCPTSHRAVV
jgi:hypothetical protein